MTPAEYSARLRAARKEIGPAILRECGKLAQVGLGAARRRLTGEVLHYRSGALRRSTDGNATLVPGGWQIQLQAGGGRDDVAYARIHEEGGVIRPKRGRFLAIPLPPVLNARGLAKSKPRDQVLTFVPIHGGSAGLLVKPSGRGKRRTFVAHWFLTPRVTMPARPYLAPSMVEMAAKVPDQLRAAIRRLVGA